MYRSQRSSTSRGFAVLLALALLAAACSSSTETTLTDSSTSDTQTDDAQSESQAEDDEAESVQDPEPTAEPAPEPTAEPAEADPEPTATPEPEPQPTFWSDVLSVGDCIIRGAEGELPTIVPCAEPHEEEIYGISRVSDGPDAPYPGEDVLADTVSLELCDQATIDFGGETWDRLPFSSFVLYPIESEWAAGDRGIMCSAGSSAEDEFKIGTAAGGTIDTDEIIVARSSLTNDGVEFKDWLVLGEDDSIDTAGSLTDGQFDLPLRRAFQVPQGFMFNANLADDETDDDATWGYRWSDGAITDLGSILPGFELSSTMSFNERSVFAAREDADSDWDVWIADDGEARPLAEGDGNQRFPTFMPDGDEVVYHDEGDLWIINVDGTNPRQLTDGPANDWESAVSPDGSTIIFSSDRDGNDDIWSISVDNDEPVNLTNHPGDEVWPFFSEDGQRIFFSSDRLRPEEDTASMMVMNADGSNQSWFATVNASQAFLVRSDVAERVEATTPTLSERYNYELIEGEAGSTVLWEHSSGRLGAQLPVGWRVTELSEGLGFLAGPRPDSYYDTWATDAVFVTLYQGDTRDDFFARVDELSVTTDSSCEQFDGSGEILTGELGDVFTANYNCGDASVGGVIAIYDPELVVGVIIEGQRDNVPDAESDSDLITNVARSVTWSS